MKKAEFLDELCQGLRFCSSSEEIMRTVNFYSEAIDDRIEDGMTEEEAVAAMGNIDDIIREVRSSWNPDRDESGETQGHVRPGEVKKVLSPVGVDKIDVFDTSGSVNIFPSPDENIHIEYIATDAWRYDITGEGTVTIRRVSNAENADRVSFGIFGKQFSIPIPNFNGIFSNELRLKLLLPAVLAPAVSINAASGDVECRNVSPAGLYVKLASGDVTAENVEANGKISMITVSGDVKCRDMSSPELAVTTVSGDIDLDGIQTASLSLKTVSGDTELTDAAVSERLTAGSVSGEINAVLTVPCRHASFDSVSGDVELDLAGTDRLYTVNTKTNSGEITVSGDPDSGENRVRVKTMSGDIDIGFGM